MSEEETVKSYKDRNVWMRGLYMVIFMVFWWVAELVTVFVVLVQFLTVLFTAKTNDRLVRFGKSLSLYQYEVLLFLTYNSEEHPYPMGEWPQAPEVEKATEEDESVQTTNVSEK